MKNKIVVTSALPYANGDIHLGHLLEYIQSDIFVRAKRLDGYEVDFICASDSHGTAITISSQNENLSEVDYIDKIRNEHLFDLEKFGVNFDIFSSTNSKENEKLTIDFFNTLKANGYIIEKEVKQLFDEYDKKFLSDREVKGICPKCGSHSQWGDGCDNCQSVYSAIDLINPIVVKESTHSIINKSSSHCFLNIESFRDTLLEFIDSKAISNQLKDKLLEWFDEPLLDWDLTRDKPYFGFDIPDLDKCFYVWFDAPIAYISSHKEYLDGIGLDYKNDWREESTELIQFIGKDIIYFHALFWVAILKGNNYRLPTKLATHGFLTVNKNKMSKSKGSFITGKKFGDKYDPELLRFYFAYKLDDTINDIDFTYDDFVVKINNELIGKLINIGSRTIALLNNKFGSQLSEISDTVFYEHIINDRQIIFDKYTELKYSEAIKIILGNATIINCYIDNNKPWNLSDNSHEVCSDCFRLFLFLIECLEPVMPLLYNRTKGLVVGNKTTEYINLIERIK